MFMSGGFILYIIFESLYYACFVEETLALAAAIRVGAKDVVSLTREQYLERLTWLKAALRISSVVQRSEVRKTVFARVTRVLEDLRLDRADGSLRTQPYCIMLCGPPGAGKTGMAMLLASKLMKAKYGKFYKTDVVTLNETDQFQSEYRTYHKVVIFDDCAATKYEKEVENPFRKIIDFVNNIRKTSLNPNVEMKGTVYIEPEVVIITTNMVHEFNTIGHWCNCPGAIVRRLSKVIHLNKDHKTGKLCYAGPSVTNIDNSLNGGASGFSEEKYTIREGGKDINHDAIAQIVCDDFILHEAHQESHIKRINESFDIVNTSANPLVCLHNDFCKTFNLIVPALPQSQENLLPWYERWMRRLCYKQACAVAQNDIDPAALLEPQGGSESHRETPHVEVPLLDKLFKNDLDYRLYVLKEFLKIQHLIALYPRLKNTQKGTQFCITPYGFKGDNYQHYIAPGKMYVKSEYFSDLYFTLDELEEYLDFWFEETQLPETKDVIPINPFEELPPVINGLYTDPLQIKHSLGISPSHNEASAILCAIGAVSDRFDLVGVEVTFYVPEVVSCDIVMKAKDGSSYLFIEAKSKKLQTAIKQSERRRDKMLQLRHESSPPWNFVAYTVKSGFSHQF